MPLHKGLTCAPGTPLNKLITNVPDVYTNPEGKLARDAIIGELKISLPQGFNVKFYPNTVRSPPSYQNDVRSVTGLTDGNWWANFSKVVLCQSMYHNTSLSFHYDKISRDVAAYNTKLKTKIYKMYAYIIKNHFITYTGNFARAKDDYIRCICTPGFVNYKKLLYNNGQWTHGEWELFHHWIKLKALGASDNEIKSTIERLRNLGLHIVDQVNENNWTNYMNYFDPREISKDDIEGESKYYQTKNFENCYYKMICYGRIVCTSRRECKVTKQYLSHDFVEHAAREYYNPPSSGGSCFSGNTLVLMADGSLKPIKDVRVGESVKTTSSDRKIALVSMPPKGNRVMYYINGLDFSFTNRHPFINPTPHQPRYMAVSPMEALQLLPTLGAEGIDQILEGSTELLGYNPNKMATFPVTVNSLSITDDIPGNNVYDLILELDGSGQFEYIVGTQEFLFVVSSELPTFTKATYSELLAASVIFHMISEMLPVINQLYSKLANSEVYTKIIIDAIHKLPQLMLGHSHPGTSKRNILAIKNKSDFVQNFKNIINAFTTDRSYNPAAGILFDHLMAILFRHLSSTIDMGCRYIPLSVDDSSSVLAVTLVDIQVTGYCFHDILQNMSIIVKAGGVTVTHKLSDNKVAAGEYRVRIKKVLYFPMESSRDISIEFKSDMKFEVFSRPINIPFSGLMCRKIPLMTLSPEGDDMAAGECHIDMRCLTNEEMEKEKKERHQCSDDELLKVANNLCHIGVDEFKKLLITV